MNNRIALIIALVFVFTIGCESTEKKPVSGGDKSTLIVELDEIFTLAGDENNEASWIGHPVLLKVDSQDNSYFYDARLQKVLKFDDNGTFLKQIAKEGEGPGEVIDVRALDIKNDTLYIFDFGQSNVKLYNPQGEFIESHSIKEARGAIKFVQFGEFNILFDLKRNDGNEAFIHFFDQDFNYLKTDDLLLQDLISELDAHSLNMFGDAAVNVSKINEEEILIAPQLYEGLLYVLEFNSADTSFIVKEELKSEAINKTYELVNSPNDFADFRTYYMGKEQGYRQLSQSTNLLNHPDGYILHFVMRDREFIRQVGVEVFDEDLHYRGYSVLFTDRDIRDDKLNWFHIPQDITSDGDLYIQSYTDDAMEMKKMRINISEK